MFQRIKNWLKEKEEKNPAGFWTKVSGFLAAVVAVGYFFIKYNYNKQKLDRLETQDALNEDNTKDKEFQHKIEVIENQKQEHLENIKVVDKKVDVLRQKMEDTQNKAKSEHELIDSIKSWDEVDKKIK
jgi:peptidoglycan hydrolase CwlO-like protein